MEPPLAQAPAPESRLGALDVSQSALRPWVAQYCAGIPEGLIWALIQVESAFNPYAVSRAGAMGLMQVMPFHFAPHEDPFHIPTNIRRGCHVLIRCLSHARSHWSAWWREHPYLSALACYNAGQAGAQRGQGWGYARLVLQIACHTYQTCLR
ncbi:MAG: lytic transglycosylase domain-containing protein [Anaerolineae bacterium]|nr:lytic transglycosylase domain-containing protein [Anaerolineae bacterium]